MLNKPIEEIIYENGVAVGVKSEGEIARAKFIVGDPSYFPTKTRKTGQVVSCIALLSHPPPNTGTCTSLQIIIPYNEVNRKHNIYVGVLSNSLEVVPKDWYVAFVSTEVETNSPHAELDAGLKLLGPVEETFYSVRDMYEPLEDGRKDKVFITKSYDPESHFKQSCEDILDIYTRCRGTQIDLSVLPPDDGPDDQ